MIMQNPHNFVLFEIAHSCLRAATISTNLDEASFFEAPISGYAKGKVSNPLGLAESIANLLTVAHIDGQKIQAHLMVPAIHTRTSVTSIEHRTAGTYRSSDFDAMRDAALDAASGDLDEAVDCIPLSFKVDGSDTDHKAFGSCGRLIKARFLVFVYPRTLLADLVAAFNAAGIEVASFRAAGRGLAESLKMLRKNAENAVLVDVGHSTTTGAVMVAGSLYDVFSIPVGGIHMTKDLVAGLGWEFSECERLKLTVGLVPEDGCLATSNHLKFLKPRVTELCALIGKRFSLYARALDGGVMLCGGASYLRGLTQEFAKELQVTSPFVCQLTRPAVEAFLPGLLINHLPNSLSSAYLSLMANTANLRDDLFARRKNDLERPFAKLRPLWTWLSELSR